MSDSTTTIAAIATAPGDAGIAIVRVSGPEALTIADRLFSCPGPIPSKRPDRRAVLGRVHSGGENIDQCILLLMRGPHSYTGEDVVEFQCHGGSVCARRILRCILNAGARMAEPGEFTRRAFLNGRMDLVQAEAVLDLIRARTDRAAASAIEQLSGGLSRQINDLYDRLMKTACDLEASLDFPDEELPVPVITGVINELSLARTAIVHMLNTWEEGHLLREGARIVIAGRPNVGKSTTLNTLLGHGRAIVSPIPGTTRDTLEESLVLDGIQARLIDTAGLRDSFCEIEREGVFRARMQIEQADLQLYVVDSSLGLFPDDSSNLASADPYRCIVVLNKIDAGNHVVEADLPADCMIVRTSMVTGEGVAELRQAMKTILEKRAGTSVAPHATISERHRQLLSDAEQRVEQTIRILQDSETSPADLASSTLRQALESIAQITGRIYGNDLLDGIFSRFCIGK